MKYIRKFEGVGDKYAEKRFFIKDPGKEFDFDYEMYLQKMKPVAYVKSRGKVEKQVAIFKNPKSLNMFEANVRAIGTIEGDLFVAQGDYYFYHQNMGSILGFGRASHIYKMQNELVFLYRDEASNSFHIGEVTSLFNKNKKDKKITETILRNIKRKNPRYNFYNSYGVFSDSKPISLIEPKKSKNILGKLKDLMFEKKYESDVKVGDTVLILSVTRYDKHFRVGEKAIINDYNKKLPYPYQIKKLDPNDNKYAITWLTRHQFRKVEPEEIEGDKYNL